MGGHAPDLASHSSLMSVCVDSAQALPGDLFVSETSPAFRAQQSLFLPTCELSLSRGTEGATASWGWGPGSPSKAGHVELKFRPTCPQTRI